MKVAYYLFLNDGNDKGDDAKDNEAESSLIYISNSMKISEQRKQIPHLPSVHLIVDPKSHR